MTAQEIFDTAAKHLLTQKVRSHGTLPLDAKRGWTDKASEGGGEVGCLYRGPNGTKCAAGIFIPDELYKTSLENYLADTAVMRAVLKAGGVNMDDFRVSALVSSLQRTHDSTPPVAWADQLAEVARCYNLDVAVLKEFAS